MTAPVPGHCILVIFIYNKSLFTIRAGNEPVGTKIPSSWTSM